MKEYFRYYTPVLVLMGISLLLFLAGAGLEILFKEVWNNITGLEMDDMGGYTFLFSAPLIMMGALSGFLLRRASLLLLIISGFVFCIMTLTRLYKRHRNRNGR
ncbi:hypothetical protein [Bifidobacterium moukalabense]|uniref:Uncharacterized protein n=2 Tax=Bifidobacterium moukalabense TaxID=1333651 RepID=W4N8W8_9BIFI|nr:hypothetical protein [Bifidobacterium moukalabense]ETY71553.1 hypothetical protein BMOU_1051 [Bifidobacterium moukalabense DSM 27321]